MSFLLALDQGTTSSRSIVFDTAGRVVALAQRELEQHYPQPGWVEHDPQEIWRTQLDTARQALAQAGITARDVLTIGIANQRETTLLWERATGRPLHRAIVWQDRRGEPMCAQLRGTPLETLVRERTGLVVDSYFCATKLRWLLDNVPGARPAAERGELAFGTVDSWLLWQLTGSRLHATDVSNASRTMLYDIARQRWDEELLAAFDIPAAVLPEVLPSSHHYGHTEADLFGAPISVCGVAGDQQAALFGQGCFTPGMAKNTYGTGCFLLMHTGNRLQRSRNGLISTAAAQPGAAAQYALEGSVFVAGAVVQWLRDGLHAIRSSSEVEALARSVPDSGGVVFVPAFTGLGAPYWNGDARGAILGLTRGSTAAHVARAAVESIAYQSAALLLAMSRDAQDGGGAPVSELRVDGGASVNDLLMQFQADLLGIPVLRPRVTETTALGAAYLAGLAAGVWQVLDELAAQWQPERVFTPGMERERAQELMARWERAVRQTVA
ncbi:glycerol kinase GlpK [Azohydromonas australica]|uniref:glycerol kinase GlpK n=1 Tax=Azohydromonas australica TaxID=364039 RepID=UPI00041B7B48|nr:glycerol kinase GlpK [Azohydromonas australica]